MTELARELKNRTQIISKWIIRVAYIFAITLLGYICVQSYMEQRAKNHIAMQLHGLEESFGAIENSFLDLAKRARGIALELDFELKNAASLREFKKKGSEINPFIAKKGDIIAPKRLVPYKAALHFRQAKAKQELQKLVSKWLQTPKEFRTKIISTDRFMRGNRPFKEYFEVLSENKVSDAKTLNDMLWTAKEIYVKAENVSISNRHAIKLIRDKIKKNGLYQSRLIEIVFRFTLSALAIILILVFLPVDLVINRMFDQLALERNRAEAESDRAAKADKTKSEFLANMSHEIRTPMNGIMGMAELMKKTTLNVRQKSYVDIIAKSGTGLLNIINDVLDFSKIDAGQMKLDIAQFSFVEVVEDVAALEAPRIAEKNLELSVRFASQLPKGFLGDAGRLRQVITNLVGNAIKFTEKGQIRIDVSAELHTNSKHEKLAVVRFGIKDSGIGIPDEKLERIFEKFSQVDGSATRKHEGTGLGLSIASSLIKLMGGEIFVESEINKGSEFSFCIPLKVANDMTDQPAAPHDVSGSRILVVDDNEVNRTILKEQLQGWGFDAAACTTGEELIAVLRQMQAQDHGVDLIVLDYQMPEMDGGEVAVSLRDDPSIDDVPIVMLTSVDQQHDGSHFSKLGVQGWLTKPARSDALLRTVIRVLQGNKSTITRPSEINHQYDCELMDSETTDILMANAGEIDANARALISEQVEYENKEYGVDILLAEDNEVNQIVFTQILNSLPYTYVIANNGEEAVALFKEKSPRIVCMDISMPVMNGIEATRQIRELEQDSRLQTPIIAVTAHAMANDKDTFLNAGMDDYVSKPVSPRKFEEIIGKWIDVRQKLRA